MPCWPRSCLLALAGALASVPAGPATAQRELRPLRNFSVHVTQPTEQDFAGGRVEIRAEVRADRPEDVLFVEFLVDDRMLFADSEAPYEVVWNTRLTAAHRITARAYGPTGLVVEDSIDTQAPPAGPGQASFTSRVDRVEVYVRVEDRKHRRLELGIDDFALLEDEVEQPIIALERSTELPLAVGFMVDCSGSMLARLGLALETAGAFIDGLVTRGDDKAFVMSFSDLPSMLQEFTDDTDRLTEALDLIAMGRFTRLFDSLIAASNEFAGHDGRRAMVVLTDGHDAASDAGLTEAIAAAQRNDVAIYPVAVGVTTRFFRERWVLERLAERTGGQIFYLSTLDDPTRIYERIAEDLRTQYRITYEPRTPAGSGEWRAIQVALHEASEHRHARIRARSGYYAQ